MTPREVAVQVAWKYIGVPYRWSGDDPLAGIDCSGLCIECLSSAGAVPQGFDRTANGLMIYFHGKAAVAPSEGCLAFYGTGGVASHVVFCLDSTFAIGANGGGSAVTTIEAAIAKNAFVKIRPIRYRADLLGFADPFA